MKVLMFGWEYPPYISGGLGTACQGIVEGLTSGEGIELAFVLPTAEGIGHGGNVKIISASDVPLSRTQLRCQLMREQAYGHTGMPRVSAYISPEQYEQLVREKYKGEQINLEGGILRIKGSYGPTLYTEISRYARVASEIATNEPHDIIHAHDWLTYQAGIEAKRVSGRPLVVHIHATEFDRSGEKINRRVYNIERKGMEAADKVIAVSELTRRTVITRYGIEPDKVITVHNAVDHSIVQNGITEKPLKEKIVTFLGRITYQKGPEFFIEAANLVLKRMKNVRFVMAGSGDMHEKMIKMVARLGISDKFHFTGFLRGADVRKMYDMSDLYIMPSVSEPFGISPLEALQSGVPVIISKQSGVAEVIESAIKVDFWDVYAMADAIHALLSYNAMADYMSKNGRNEVWGMTWRDTGSKIRYIYQELTNLVAC